MLLSNIFLQTKESTIFINITLISLGFFAKLIEFFSFQIMSGIVTLKPIMLYSSLNCICLTKVFLDKNKYILFFNFHFFKKQSNRLVAYPEHIANKQESRVCGRSQLFSATDRK